MTLQLKIADPDPSNFLMLYNDQGSSAECNVQFWHPLPREGYLPAGDVCEASPSSWIYHSGAPLGQVLLIAADSASPDDVSHPMDFQLLWTDAGSGAELQGSLWQMVPPAGYTALGHCCTFSFEGPPSKPDPSQYYCVKSSLVASGTAGAQIWNSAGSGADTDVAIYSPTAPVFFADLHTFWAVTGSFGPPISVVASVLPLASVTPPT